MNDLRSLIEAAEHQRFIREAEDRGLQATDNIITALEKDEKFADLTKHLPQSTKRMGILFLLHTLADNIPDQEMRKKAKVGAAHLLSREIGNGLDVVLAADGWQELIKEIMKHDTHGIPDSAR
jgi:hypothetical protein